MDSISSCIVVYCLQALYEGGGSFDAYSYPFALVVLGSILEIESSNSAEAFFARGQEKKEERREGRSRK